MPIYAYKCDSCGHSKDVLQKMSDPLLTDCPACGKSSFKKQLTAAGFQLKGSGWYATDFKGGPAAPAETEGGAKAEPKTDSKQDGKQEAKQDSKSGGESTTSTGSTPSGSTSSGATSSGDSAATTKPKTASAPAGPAASNVSASAAATGADRPRAGGANR